METGEMQFEKKSFASRLKSMLRVDAQRVFKGYFFYIMAGISLLIPIAVLLMTSFNMGGESAADSMGFSNAWQIIASLSSDSSGMSITSMCGMNLVYFLVLIFGSVLVSEDFRSGYAKNLFSVRAKKNDYAVSKILTVSAAGVLMLLCFFAGAMIGGAIAGLSFALEGANAANAVFCLLAKIFLVPLFSSLAIVFGCAAKKRTWLSVLLSLAAGMLLFMIVPMMTPLDAGIFQTVLCLAGGVAFSVVFGVVTDQVLKRTNLA